MRYFAKIVKDAEGYYQVSFPELDGCLTYGDTLEDALANAAEALDGWLEVHFNRTQHVPSPKLRRGKHYHAVRVNPQIALAVALRTSRRERRLSQRQVSYQDLINKFGTPTFADHLEAIAVCDFDTRRECAAKLGISMSTLRAYTSGKRTPSVANACGNGEAFGLLTSTVH